MKTSTYRRKKKGHKIFHFFKCNKIPCSREPWVHVTNDVTEAHRLRKSRLPLPWFWMSLLETLCPPSPISASSPLTSAFIPEVLLRLASGLGELELRAEKPRTLFSWWKAQRGAGGRPAWLGRRSQICPQFLSTSLCTGYLDQTQLLTAHQSSSLQNYQSSEVLSLHLEKYWSTGFFCFVNLIFLEALQ